MVRVLSTTGSTGGGFFNVSVNFADNTSDTISGNGLSFTTNAGWNRTFADWFISGSGGYAQNVQTYLITYSNSYYIYSGNVRHRFGTDCVDGQRGRFA